jgi:hypothetical protein
MRWVFLEIEQKTGSPLKLINNPQTISEHLYNRQLELGITQDEWPVACGLMPKISLTGSFGVCSHTLRFILK